MWWCEKASKPAKTQKMELIYILNVMIIINGKFNFTHTPKARGNRPQTGRVLNVIVKKKSERRQIFRGVQ